MMKVNHQEILVPNISNLKDEMQFQKHNSYN